MILIFARSYPVKDTLIPSSDPDKPWFIPARASYVPRPPRPSPPDPPQRLLLRPLHAPPQRLLGPRRSVRPSVPPPSPLTRPRTADAFDPDRFLDARLHTYLTPNPFIFLPFNAGPRICLGQQFAYNEMSFFLVRLLQAFDAVALAPAAHPPADRVPPAWRGAPGRKGVERMWPKAHLTLYSKVRGVWSWGTRGADAGCRAGCG